MRLNKKHSITNLIVEKRLGIPPDYQYKALRGNNFLISNWHSNKFTVLKALSEFNKDARLLDLGIGSGNFEFLYANHVKNIVGIDYNDEAIAFVKKKLKAENVRNVKLICEDIRNLNHINFTYKFDFIIVVDALEHITISEAGRLIKTLRRLLVPQGRVCLITPNYKSHWIILEFFLDIFSWVPKQAGEQHLAKYYETNLVSIFVKNGFIKERVNSFNLFSFMIPIRTVSNFFSLLEIRVPLQIGPMLAGVFKLKSNEN